MEPMKPFYKILQSGKVLVGSLEVVSESQYKCILGSRIWSVGCSRVFLVLKKVVLNISVSDIPPASSTGVFVGRVHGRLLVSYV